jgi:hypothetical protein
VAAWQSFDGPIGARQADQLVTGRFVPWGVDTPRGTQTALVQQIPTLYAPPRGLAPDPAQPLLARLTWLQAAHYGAAMGLELVTPAIEATIRAHGLELETTPAGRSRLSSAAQYSRAWFRAMDDALEAAAHAAAGSGLAPQFWHDPGLLPWTGAWPEWTTVDASSPYVGQLTRFVIYPKGWRR